MMATATNVEVVGYRVLGAFSACFIRTTGTDATMTTTHKPAVAKATSGIDLPFKSAIDILLYGNNLSQKHTNVNRVTGKDSNAA